MPTLYKQLKKLPGTAIPATSAVSTGHGRRARPTIKAVLVPAWTGFAGTARVAQVRRTVTRSGRSSCFKLHERLCRVPGGWPAAVRSPLRGPAAPKTGTPGSAAVVEGHLIAVGVRERESAAERPVDGR